MVGVIAPLWCASIVMGWRSVRHDDSASHTTFEWLGQYATVHPDIFEGNISVNGADSDDLEECSMIVRNQG